MVSQHRLKSWFLQHGHLRGQGAAGNILTCFFHSSQHYPAGIAWGPW